MQMITKLNKMVEAGMAEKVISMMGMVLMLVVIVMVVMMAWVHGWVINDDNWDDYSDG